MLELILLLALIGCAAYFIVTYIPMMAPFKTLITILAVVFCILVLIRAFGLDVAVPRFR